MSFLILSSFWKAIFSPFYSILSVLFKNHLFYSVTSLHKFKFDLNIDTIDSIFFLKLFWYLKKIFGILMLQPALYTRLYDKPSIYNQKYYSVLCFHYLYNNCVWVLQKTCFFKYRNDFQSNGMLQSNVCL